MLKIMGWSGALMAEGTERRERTKKSGWFWPFGMMATGLAGVFVVALRGCWHRRLSWPVRMQGYSYQVCLGCGVKRLFDEKRFRAYGPYRYDLNELIAWSRAASGESADAAESQVERPAS
jgi:hypothetical protein